MITQQVNQKLPRCENLRRLDKDHVFALVLTLGSVQNAAASAVQEAKQRAAYAW